MTVTVLWAAPVEVGRVAQLLSDGDRERLAALRAAPDRNRFATGRALLRLGTSRLAGGAADEVVLDSTCANCGRPHGRPTLVHPSVDVQLSVTHSADRVLLAFGVQTGVGIDIEPWGATDFAGFDAVALTAGERAEVQALPVPQADRARTALWVAKEAVLKLQGVGLAVEPNTVHVGLGATLATSGLGLVQLTALDVGADYCARLATAGQTPPTVELIDANDWLAG